MKSEKNVVVDNTNIEAWECNPYVIMAQEFGYRVEFVRSNTVWRNDVEECFKRNIHKVPKEVIQSMKDRMQELSVEKCLESKSPW